MECKLINMWLMVSVGLIYYQWLVVSTTIFQDFRIKVIYVCWNVFSCLFAVKERAGLTGEVIAK